MMRAITIACGCLLALTARGQDPQFTQFYAAPTYLNPAFVGTSTQSRLSGNYRMQWPGIPGAFTVENVAFDHFAPYINSGFGFIATREKLGSGGLQNLNVGLQYAYEARLNRNLYFRPGLQFSFGHRSINFGDLVFNDQLNRPAGVATLETPILDPVNYFDMATGVLFNTQVWWLGFATHHLNQPDESLYQNNPSYLIRKFSFHGGIRKRIKKRYTTKSTEFLFAFDYRAQADFDQLDLGGYVEIDPIVFGVWYRGLPVKSNNQGSVNHDALNILVGYYAGRYKFGYSYDLTISRLGLGQSGGSHEISMSYEWANKRNKRLAKRRIIPCAKF